jgi:hypothetical protein
MYFEIVKKVGTAETNYVSDARVWELTIVRPYQEWAERNGHIVNYFVYTKLANHDFYVYIDEEFLSMYHSIDLSRLLINVINEEIYRFMGSKMKKPWEHVYNMLDVVNDLQQDIRQLSAAKCKQICRYILDLRETSLREKRYSIFHKQIEYMEKHGLGFLEISDVPGTYLLLQNKFKMQLKFQLQHYVKKTFIEDEAEIKELERIVEIIEKNEEILEQRVERLKTHENDKKYCECVEKELPLIELTDADKQKIRGIVYNSDPNNREFRKEKSKSRISLCIPEKISSKIDKDKKEDSLEEKIKRMTSTDFLPRVGSGGPYNR